MKRTTSRTSRAQDRLSIRRGLMTFAGYGKLRLNSQLLHKLCLSDGTELDPYPAASEDALLKTYLAPT